MTRQGKEPWTIEQREDGSLQLIPEDGSSPWPVDEILTDTDFITMYRFDAETERKAFRLAEQLEVAPNRDREIDKALKAWSQQLAQYALNFTDYAVVQAFEDAGIKVVEWVSEKDMRVCNSCYALNGQHLHVDEIPRKPHWGCRCRIRPVFRKEEGSEVVESPV